MLLLSWTVVGVLLALWSALVALGHLLLTALLGGAGHLPVGALALPESWTTWLPQGVSESITQALEAAQPLLQSLLGTLPALSGGVTVLAWALWAAGALLLILAGGAAHLGLRRWQRWPAPTPRVTLLPS